MSKPRPKWLTVESEQDIVDLYSEVCQRNRSIRMAILDHISSPSAIVFPLKRVAAELHKYGVLVLVDGAHAPGQIPVNLEELGEAGVDFYTGNLHKWGFSPRGTAILWVHPEHQGRIRPLTTSNVYKKSFQADFEVIGTNDYSNYLAAGAGVDFFHAIGGFEKIHGYVTSLLTWAQDMMSQALGTETLQIPASMEAPYLRLVALPHLADGRETCFDTAESLIKEIMAEFKVVTQITCFSGKFWVRLSGSIYSQKDDYLQLRDALKTKFASQ
eukprot:maker-scaffold414_size178625-snap-gene-0.34 protein:Tk11239 transcript:maker-scaffold414_size178625-snap-gene-0.34-mRNA-1 annotation:"hypothetical protein CGI_10027365"